MASENQVSALDAVKKAIDALMVDSSLDDDTRGDLLEEIKDYAEEQQEMLNEDDDDDDDMDEDNEEEEDDEDDA